MYRRAAVVPVFLLAALAVAQAQVPDSLKALAARSSEPGFSAAVLAASDAATTMPGVLAILEAMAPLAAGSSRRTLFLALAPLLELEERWLDAAAAWESGARAVAGTPDAGFLQNAGFCRLAGGDFDGALALSRAATLADPTSAGRSCLLDAFAYYLGGQNEPALASALTAIASAEPRIEPSALLLAAALSEGAERDGYLARLRSRYPGRPETLDGLGPRFALLSLGRIGAGDWLRPAAVPATESPAAGAVSAKADADSTTAFYQVGAFRSKANADALVKRLAVTGLRVSIAARKAADGVETIIVYVEAGPDSGATLLALKDAGFEAWPLSSAP